MSAITPSASARQLAAAFHAGDAEFLAGLTPADRDAQLRAREALFLYTDQLWDHVKARARLEGGSWSHRAASDPASGGGVAAMRDLAAELVANVRDAQHQAGD